MWLADELVDWVIPGPQQAGHGGGHTEYEGAEHPGPRRPGDRSRSRYVLAAVGNGMIAAVFVKLVAQRMQPRQRILRLANLITLSRVVSAALLAGTAAAPMIGQRTALLALLWSGPSDWIDGPVARRRGATRLGAVLDIEADSWLTLWAAAAAWRTGGLSPSCLVTPAMRYFIPWLELRHQRRRSADRWWQRVAGSVQTLSLVLALAPSPRLKQWARLVGPFGVGAQLMAMASTAKSLVWERRLTEDQRREAPQVIEGRLLGSRR